MVGPKRKTSGDDISPLDILRCKLREGGRIEHLVHGRCESSRDLIRIALGHR